MFLVILARDEPLFNKNRFGYQVTGSGGRITIGHIFAFDIADRFDSGGNVSDDHTLLGRTALFFNGRKSFDVAFGFGHDIGKWSEVSQVDTAMTHGFNHGRIICGYDQLHFFIEGFFQVIFKAPIVFDNGLSILIRQ